MRDLVDFAYLLAEARGAPAAAILVATEMSRSGVDALGPAHDDATRLLRDQALRLGLVASGGQPDVSRCAELILVCDILAAVPVAPTPRPKSPSLVFTAPAAARQLMEGQRLDVLVSDIIRMASSEVRIGGPFWNEDGLETLLEVLGPAVAGRNVRCIFYVHTPTERSYLGKVRTWMRDLEAEQRVTVRWYAGPLKSLMHAKFVTADRTRGYLGSANFTGFGLTQHVEMGVELTSDQTAQLLGFLDALEAGDLFSDGPPE